MPLRFRNIDATPADPVEAWGVEGMLAAIDRGYAEDWRKLASAIIANPELRDVYDEARAAAESISTVAYLDAVIASASRTPDVVALDRLRSAFRGTRMTQAELAERLGTSRTRLNSYLAGSTVPSMAVLVSIEQIAERRRAPGIAKNLALT